MKINCIFGRDYDNALYAVRYAGNDEDEFTRLFNLWNNAAYVHAFCQENKDDLQEAFKGSITVEKAANEIRDEAVLMEKQLFYYYDCIKLQQLFKPLSNNEFTLYPLQKSKASLSKEIRRPKIRIYAIRLAPNVFVITGGGIKLTETMNDRPHLKEELRKINLVKDWLKEKGIDVPEAIN
ncbi:hypothetical protein SAMN05518672_103473 [Chitinophaga sp. CF118]|uniref:hypothetical protein n=1 Tax=Chitinophaga sp. CF118 TaxID=1884367 RepID=UPI0008F4010F|nr:hypothetical protein [Chitinophaga sp. CF118]SFD84372.1 hypothetical protein SAMN05518672_103473 [Chitinophaga sp. CF118]